jgi:hypothetical protein
VFYFYLTSLLLIVVSHNLDAKHWNVFLAAGQSNMVGSRDYSVIHSDGSLDSGIAFYMVAGGFGSETVSDGWQTFSDIDGKQGPERAFGRVLVDAGVPNVAFVKDAINGSSLYDDFRKSALDGRRLYGSMLTTFQAALSALEESGDTYTVNAMIWLQSTADTRNVTRGTSYEQNLKDFILDVGNDLSLPSLLFITAKHPAFWSNGALSSTVRNARVDVSLGNPLVGIIDCEGTAHVGDLIHYDAESKEKVGKRFAYNYLHGEYTFLHISWKTMVLRLRWFLRRMTTAMAVRSSRNTFGIRARFQELMVILSN